MNIAEWLKEWAVPLSAGVTLLLAVAAFWTIWIQHERRMQTEKLQFANDLIEWTLDGIEIFSSISSISSFPSGPLFAKVVDTTLRTRVMVPIADRISRRLCLRVQKLESILDSFVKLSYDEEQRKSGYPNFQGVAKECLAGFIWLSEEVYKAKGYLIC